MVDLRDKQSFDIDFNTRNRALFFATIFCVYIIKNTIFINFNTRNRALFFATLEFIQYCERRLFISILVIELCSLQLHIRIRNE